MRRLSTLLCLLCLNACGDSESTTEPDPVTDAAEAPRTDLTDEETATAKPPPFTELLEAGVGMYLGLATITDTVEEDGVTTVTFDVESGPRCLHGAPYRMAYREGPSDDLLIFLGGGGLCWSDFCAAFDEAPPGMPLGDAINPDKESNPFRNFDVAYFPYCDGSLFAGDAQHDDDGDGSIDRDHAGLRNLSAALDVIRDLFGAPNRVVLAGSSGGGYGTIIAAPLVRIMWGEVPIFVVNDSGPGIARGAKEPGFVEQLLSEFAAARFIPDSCVDCVSDGHLTGLLAWALAEDPNLKLAVFSFLQDFVIGTMFLAIGAEAYEESLRAEMAELQAAEPDRFRYMLIQGSNHTGLFGDIAVFGGLIPEGVDTNFIQLSGLDDTRYQDTSLGDWLQWMLDGDERWVTLVED